MNIKNVLADISKDFIDDLYHDKTSKRLSDLNHLILISKSNCLKNNNSLDKLVLESFPYIISKKDMVKSDIKIIKDDSLTHLLKNPNCINSILLWKIISEKLKIDNRLVITIKSDEVKTSVLKSWIKNDLHLEPQSKNKNKILKTSVKKNINNFGVNFDIKNYEKFSKEMNELNLKTEYKNSKVFVTHQIKENEQ